MRNLIFILSVVSLSCSSKMKNKSGNSAITKETISLYMVSKIDSLNSFYFIYCTKDGENYKVISKKDYKNFNLVKIKLGQYYDFELKNFPDYSENNNPLIGFNSVEPCFMLDKETKICREKNLKGLFTTKDIIGLYYLK